VGTVTRLAVTAGGRTFAPKAMRRICLDELDRLNAYAAGQP
jgi:hypothetical protein